MRNRRRRRIFPVIPDSYRRVGIRLCRAEPPGLPVAESAAVATGFALVRVVRWCEDGYRIDLKDFCLMITIRASQAIVAGRLSRHLRLASNKLRTDYWNIIIMRDINR
jgi:hypothetical protein